MGRPAGQHGNGATGPGGKGLSTGKVHGANKQLGVRVKGNPILPKGQGASSAGGSKANPGHGQATGKGPNGHGGEAQGGRGEGAKPGEASGLPRETNGHKGKDGHGKLGPSGPTTEQGGNPNKERGQVELPGLQVSEPNPGPADGHEGANNKAGPIRGHNQQDIGANTGNNQGDARDRVRTGGQIKQHGPRTGEANEQSGPADEDSSKDNGVDRTTPKRDSLSEEDDLGASSTSPSDEESAQGGTPMTDVEEYEEEIDLLEKSRAKKWKGEKLKGNLKKEFIGNNMVTVTGDLSFSFNVNEDEAKDPSDQPIYQFFYDLERLTNTLAKAQNILCHNLVEYHWPSQNLGAHL